MFYCKCDSIAQKNNCNYNRIIKIKIYLLMSCKNKSNKIRIVIRPWCHNEFTLLLNFKGNFITFGPIRTASQYVKKTI